MKRVPRALSFVFFDALIEDWNEKPAKKNAELVSVILFFTVTMVFMVWDAKRNAPDGPSNWSFVILFVVFAVALWLRQYLIKKLP